MSWIPISAGSFDFTTPPPSLPPPEKRAQEQVWPWGENWMNGMGGDGTGDGWVVYYYDFNFTNRTPQ